jgi:radical SAM superfamily enzyme YgiQ (UPF0313 family)
LANGRTENLLKYSDEQWQIMKEAGLKSILIGAESGDEQIMQLIEKQATVQDTIKFTKKCKEFDIWVYFSFIVGFPHPNPDAVKEEQEKFFLREIKAFYKIVDDIYSISKKHSILLFLYTPYPGTPLYSLSEKHGFKGASSLEGWAHYELNMRNTPWIDEKKEKLVDQLMVSVFPFICNLYKEKVSRMPGLKGLFFHLFHLFLEKSASLRWQHKFFKFPLEYKMLKYYFKNRNKW